MKKILVLLFLAIVSVSCDKVDNGEVIILTIASQNGDYQMRTADKACYIAKENYGADMEAPWMFMCETIAGFDYKEGYEYMLEVTRKVADGSNLANSIGPGGCVILYEYTLKKQLSKVAKGAESLDGFLPDGDFLELKGLVLERNVKNAWTSSRRGEILKLKLSEPLFDYGITMDDVVYLRCAYPSDVTLEQGGTYIFKVAGITTTTAMKFFAVYGSAKEKLN